MLISSRTERVADEGAGLQHRADLAGGDRFVRLGPEDRHGAGVGLGEPSSMSSVVDLPALLARVTQLFRRAAPTGRPRALLVPAHGEPGKT